MAVKLFNRWETTDIKVEDPGLVRYIALDAVYVPKTGARYAGNKFYKSKINIVERFINKLMIPGHKGKKHVKTSGRCTGKAATAYKLTESVLSILEKKTNKNPVAVLVKAVENAAPREEVISIEYGGARYPKALECSPQRRIDLALRYFVQGAYAASFNKKKSAVNALADEILNAYNMSGNSNAIAKKFEVERQADSSR